MLFPDFVTGTVNNMTIEITNSTSSIDTQWDPPTCERRISYWRLILWIDSDNISSTLVNVTLPSTILFYTIDISISEKIGILENDSSILVLKPCQIYHIDCVTDWADGRSYKVEKSISTECPPSLVTSRVDGVGLGVILLLSVLGFMILTTVGVGVYYYRIR